MTGLSVVTHELKLLCKLNDCACSSKKSAMYREIQKETSSHLETRPSTYSKIILENLSIDDCCQNSHPPSIVLPLFCNRFILYGISILNVTPLHLREI